MSAPKVNGHERTRRTDGGWRRKGMRHESRSETNTGAELIISIVVFISGVLIAYLSLLLNQQYPVMMSIGSLVSPTGGQATVGGFRIKHWLVGIALLVFAAGVYFTNSENFMLKQLGLAMAGAGVFLTLDETDSVVCTLTTGIYPCADTI